MWAVSIHTSSGDRNQRRPKSMGTVTGPGTGTATEKTEVGEISQNCHDIDIVIDTVTVTDTVTLPANECHWGAAYQS